MNQLSYFNLVCKYPTLRGFINQCYLRDETDKLFDFLMAIETEENPTYA